MSKKGVPDNEKELFEYVFNAVASFIRSNSAPGTPGFGFDGSQEEAKKVMNKYKEFSRKTGERNARVTVYKRLRVKVLEKMHFLIFGSLANVQLMDIEEGKTELSTLQERQGDISSSGGK